MKILKMKKVFQGFDPIPKNLGGKGWHSIEEELTTNNLPLQLKELPNNYSLSVRFIIELSNKAIINGEYEILTGNTACRPFEKPSTQEEYENFLKVLKFFEENT